VTLLAQLSDEGPPTPLPARPAARASSSGERAGPRRFFGELASLFRFLTLSGDEPSSLRRPVGGHKRVAWSESVPLATIKAIAHASGHHLAEVLLAGVAGALERYERAHGPITRQVRALLPVALPAKASDGELGNHYASVFVNLPLGIPDPQARLEAIARDLAALRGQSASRMAVGLTRLAGAVAPGIERRAVRRWSRRASLVVSSLAGPPVPVRVAGCRLRAPIVWAPVPASIALSLTFFGYAGTLCVGVMADAAAIERPEELVAGFRAAIDDLGRPGAGAPRDSG
jgi:WS/DGAT/MGAT family acyltransferase